MAGRVGAERTRATTPVGRLGRRDRRLGRAQHRRTLALLSVLALFAALLGGLGSTGLATSPKSAAAAGPGEYGPPEWWPLRGSNLIGCARNSPDGGSLHVCEGNYHPVWAIDIQANEGQPIYASGAGLAKVYENTTGCSGYGRAVVVEHGGSTKSLYGHMSQFSDALKASPNGVWVDQNTVIGYVGHTGDVSNCSYNHLHYEETTNGGFWASATDPGVFKACNGSQPVSYPTAFGKSSWNGFPGHIYTAVNDGTACDGGSTGPSPQSISFGALPDRVYGEAPFNVSATATSGLPVSFTAGPLAVCTASGSTISVGEIGTCTVTAKQAGNDDWLPAPDVSQAFRLTPAPTTTTVTAEPAGSADFGDKVTFTASVSASPPSTAVPVGTVSFADGARVLGGDLPLDSAHTSVSTNALTPGTHTITVSYSGSTNFLSSSGSVEQTVTCQTTISKSKFVVLVVKASTCIAPGVTITGLITVKPGGALAVQGATLNGTVTSTSARAILVCNSTVKGIMSVRSTSGFVVVGGAQMDSGQWCPGNVISGSVRLASNLNLIELGGNRISGLVSVTGTNSGPDGDEASTGIAANKIIGSLNCANNSPAPTNYGQQNSVKLLRSGQCRASDF